MTQANRYLSKHGMCDAWPMTSADTSNAHGAIVIPVYDERETLPITIASLAANPPARLAHTLVICVVNNRSEDHAPKTALQANAETMAWIAHFQRRSNLRLVMIDAASPGKTLPPKGGVGLARRIGMDWAVRILAANGATHPIIACLDADTVVDPSYLDALCSWRDSKNAWAAVLRFAHPTDGPWGEAIAQYEMFLRYHVLGLRHAQSPFAFHTIGSCMACTVDAYVAVSGMNQRQAGEDFYFLQKLGKTGPVTGIENTVVRPSARPSHRVPFGTGARMQQFIDQPDEPYLVYDPRVYDVLGAWVAAINQLNHGDQPLTIAADIHPALAVFLVRRDFESVWAALQRNAKDKRTLQLQLHRWFDGFATLKLIHHLRDAVWPPVPLERAIRAAVWLPKDCAANLDALREMDRMDKPAGLSRR